MPSSKLVRAIRRVDAHIDEVATSRDHRDVLRRELMQVVAMGRDPGPHLGRLRVRWPRHLLERFQYVSASLHAVGRLGVALPTAACAAGLRESDLAYAIGLVERSGRDLSYVTANTDDGLRAAVEAAFENLVVHIDHRAVEDLLLSAIEAHAVSRDGHGVEVYGSMYGQTVVDAPDINGIRTHTVTVTRATTQIKAKATAEEVWPSSQSHAVHQLVASEMFGRATRVVGEFHTHPLRSWCSLVANKAWLYSAADAAHVKIWSAEQLATGDRGRFSLVVAHAPGREKGAATRREARNRVRLRIGQYHVVLGAYRVQADGDLDNDLALRVGRSGQDDGS